MSMSRRKAIRAIALAVPALKFMPAYAFKPMQGAPFKGTRESLKSYVVPEWFRDAKFGIWAHWGPQSAIEAGDWYARNMYMEGSGQNKHFIEHYGHPSKIGYKDTIPNWKAEKFDPDYLLGLYKKAGAKYFMTMGAHHDNFDLWNSAHNNWNAVKMGPKKDIVGMFKKAAQKHGLKFGISDHLWISPKWFSTSKGADRDGPYAGMHYDGANPQFASLYGDSEKVFTDLPWNEDGISDTWKKHWYLRIKDLIDNYEPDLLYCDGAIPFEEQGLTILANLYNQSAAKNGGITQAVYTSKRAEDSQVGTCVFDVERGVVDSIWPRPWQTDTCIGDWHYNRQMIGHYKTPKTVVDMLVDIVSRNGNLMLNFPLPASGMLDSDELNTLDGITKWMAVNSEGIYATRPWKIFGESPAAPAVKETSFNESKRQDLTFNDVRFTIKGKTLYTFFMGWPQNGQVIIKPLGNNSPQQTGEIEKVELLGHGKVEFTRDNEGLKVSLPSQKPCEHAYTLKLSGTHLT
jgi:alpha-L-fucosidase